MEEIHNNTRNTEIIETKEDPEKWIKNHIMGGQDFQQGFRAKYMQKLGIINHANSFKSNTLNDSSIQQDRATSMVGSINNTLLDNKHRTNSTQSLNNQTYNNQQQYNSSSDLMSDEKQQKHKIISYSQLQKHEKLQKQLKEDENDKKLVVEKTFTYENIQLNFMVRTDEQARQNYFDKLIHNKILKMQPSKKQQTIIIFDWDDTILCTTYLGNQGFIELKQEVNSQIAQLDISASKILQKSISYGDTYIITNAAQGWVEYSSKLYFPKVNDILNQKKITVISARSGYEDLFPNDCHKWKIEAFKNIKKDYNENILTNLICLGDSHIEMDAAHSLAKFFNQVLVKTIKFRESPKPEELVKQQDLVCDKFEQIYKNLRNLTIRLEKKAQDKEKEKDKNEDESKDDKQQNSNKELKQQEQQKTDKQIPDNKN